MVYNEIRDTIESIMTSIHMVMQSEMERDQERDRAAREFIYFADIMYDSHAKTYKIMVIMLHYHNNT